MKINKIVTASTGFAVIIAIAALLILVAPFLFIWAANTLGADIAHTPINYLAAVVLMLLLRGGKQCL